MKINIDGLEVLWPYEYIYPEQLQCQSGARGRQSTSDAELDAVSCSEFLMYVLCLLLSRCRHESSKGDAARWTLLAGDADGNRCVSCSPQAECLAVELRSHVHS